MIKLESLIHAVQSAVSSATEAVARQNLDIFQTYFDEVTDGNELESIVRASLSSVDSAITEDNNDAAEASLREAAQALAASAARLRSQQDGQGSGEDGPEAERYYVPKRVTIQYPCLGPSGKPDVKNVQVPLLTLVPMRVPEMAEVRFRADLELSVEDDVTLNVSFVPTQGGVKAAEIPQSQFEAEGGDGTTRNSSATIEIVINGKRSTDGLLKIVEGYEKALRAQIPG